MNGPEARTSSLSEELRRAFDQSFAAPIKPAASTGERLLSIRVGGETVALPLVGKSVQLSGLAVDRAIVRLQSHAREFLGLVAVRGIILPAFDLASFAAIPSGGLRWLALMRLPAPAALAFEDMDRLLDIAVTDIVPMASSDSGGHPFRLVTRLARFEERTLPVLDLDAIAEMIRRGASSRALP